MSAVTAKLVAMFEGINAALATLRLDTCAGVNLDLYEAALAPTAPTGMLSGNGPPAVAELRAVDLRIEHSRAPRHESRQHRPAQRRPHARGQGSR